MSRPFSISATIFASLIASVALLTTVSRPASAQGWANGFDRPNAPRATTTTTPPNSASASSGQSMLIHITGGVGAGLGGRDFTRDRDASGARTQDAYSALEGFGMGFEFGVPVAGSMFFVPRLAFNTNSFSYVPDATDPTETVNRSVTMLHFGLGFLADTAVGDSPLHLIFAAGFQFGAVLADTADFIDAGNTTNNTTTTTSYDLGIGGFGEFGFAFKVTPQLAIVVNFHFEGYLLAVNKIEVTFNDGSPTQVTNFKDGQIQTSGGNPATQRKDPEMHGVWLFSVGVVIFL